MDGSEAKAISNSLELVSRRLGAIERRLTALESPLAGSGSMGDRTGVGDPRASKDHDAARSASDVLEAQARQAWATVDPRQSGEIGKVSVVGGADVARMTRLSCDACGCLFGVVDYDLLKKESGLQCPRTHCGSMMIYKNRGWFR